MHARNRAAKAKHCKVTKGKGKEEKCTATAKTSKATYGNDVKAKA